ncbi:hypothetical protein ACEP6V_21365 [Pseudomonas aeruginosa]|uniref:hypothetical protein n=1 Tax=Pseudomonas aeruginosa TaxID=287 RepID=UPI000B5A963B|nr:hypothetical protein [Pseudomonas aeruginosa]ASJ88722.1 hypothetical protein PSA83_06596 [Pseudomonas aeruginosa]ELN4740376.1 hypothetical protein [Escherichia coli]HCF3026437.1 hypothetical protein [Pseudomonas aeruginosa]
MQTNTLRTSDQPAGNAADSSLTIARHYSCGAVAVHVADCGGSYDLYADDSFTEYLGNVCSLSEGERFLQAQ